LSAERLPWGCLPSSRHQLPASSRKAAHGLSPFRPRRFTRPRRLHPPAALWVYFTPQPRTGFTLQGFSLPHSGFASSATRALSSLTKVCYRRLPVDATSLGPVLRALFRARSPSLSRWRLADDPARSPPELLLLQVFPLHDRCVRGKRTLPLMTLLAGSTNRTRKWPSAFRPGVWLASLEAADLLEVPDLPLVPTCVDRPR